MQEPLKDPATLKMCRYTTLCEYYYVSLKASNIHKVV